MMYGQHYSEFEVPGYSSSAPRDSGEIELKSTLVSLEETRESCDYDSPRKPHYHCEKELDLLPRNHTGKNPIK